MIGPLLFAILLALAVLLLFIAVWRYSVNRNPVDARLAEYGSESEESQSAAGGPAGRHRRWTITNRLLNGFGQGPKLARLLLRADVPVTAAEYALVCVTLGVAGMALGSLRGGLALGLTLSILLGYLPVAYLNSRASKRQQALMVQLPDVLTLLTGGLRAGLGLPQAIDLVVHQAPDPAAKEFGRVVRAINLGLPLQTGLSDLVERMGGDDLELVVSAIIVQYEMGGNLAETLGIIGETVRDRIRIKREVRVYTAQQRLTGYVLGAMPIGLGVVLFVINPNYMRNLFLPGWVMLPAAGGVMLVVGFIVIQRILDIET
jgi:tight adherence protein B